MQLLKMRVPDVVFKLFVPWGDAWSYKFPPDCASLLQG